MSFQKPSGDVAVISSGSMEIASGTLQIDLNLKVNISNFGTSYNMDVLDVGGIEVDFNFVEQIGDINDFKINVPAFEFTCRDIVVDSSDASSTDLLVDMIAKLNANDLIVIKVTFNSRSDYYFCTRAETEFSYSNRTVKFDAKHPLIYKVEPYGVTWDSSVFSGKTVPSAIYDGSSQYVSVYPKDLIKEYINALSLSPSTVYKSVLYTLDSTDTASLLDGAKAFVVLQSLVNIYGFGAATNIVRGLALSENAIIGNILGYAFYVPRNQKDDAYKATLSADDFESIELDYSFKNVRQFDFSMTLGDQDLTTDNVSISTSESINADGRNNVNVTYGIIDGVQGAEWDDSGSVIGGIAELFMFGNSNSPSISADNKNSIINGYKDTFRVPRSIGSTDAGSYISGKIFGVETLKPYEFFTVSSGVHPLVDGKDFRPSYLKYNLKDDIIEFEAYEF